MLARPDANSFELLPVGRSQAPEARIFCDIFNLDGTPFEGDPRQVLRRNLDRARAWIHVLRRPGDGVLLLHPGDDGRPTPLDTGSYFDLTTADVAGSLRKRIQTLEAMGIPVEYSFHEDSPSQHEIDLRHTDALSMADSVMTFRLGRSEGGHRGGALRHLHAQAARGRGRGCTPTSACSRARNAFHEPGDPYKLSKVAKGFIAGLLRHAHEITAITNQTVNSYKRLVPGFEAPAYVSWARNNRSALVRVPIAKSKVNRPASSTGARSGVQPVPRLRRDPRRRAEGDRGGLRAATRGTNIFELTDEERAAERLEPLPQSLDGAHRDGAVRARRRDARRAHLRVVPAQQAAGVGHTSPRSRRSRSTGTSARCDGTLRHEVPDRRLSAVGVLREGVEIDFCPQCRGVWLDRGELDKIIDRAANTLAGSTPACGTGAQRRGREYRERLRPGTTSPTTTDATASGASAASSTTCSTSTERSRTAPRSPCRARRARARASRPRPSGESLPRRPAGAHAT